MSTTLEPETTEPETTEPETVSELSARQEGGRKPGLLETLALDLILPSPLNPRGLFDGDALESLAASIAERGVEQPLTVRLRVAPEADGGTGYELIDGERRYRAAKMAGLTEVPVIVKDVPSDREALVSISGKAAPKEPETSDDAEAYTPREIAWDREEVPV